jgi:hypothetical protein
MVNRRNFRHVRTIVSIVFGISLGLALPLLIRPVAPWQLDPDERAKRDVERLVRALELDSHQNTVIRGILDNTQSQLRALRDDTIPRFHKIRISTDSQIIAVLTPEQREEFRVMNEEKMREMKKHFPQMGSLPLSPAG